MTKHACLLQGLTTLKLTIDRAAIEGYSRAAGSGIWGLLYSHINRYTYSTATASVAASILQSMPRTLSKVTLQLQSNQDVTAIPLHEGECALLRPTLAGLPNLQSISTAGPGAAACLPKGPSLTANLSQLTCLRLGTIRSAAEVAELLSALPASLQQLHLDVDIPDRLEQERTVQMQHLTALTTLHVTGEGFILGQHSKLPPSIVNLTVPMVLRATPLLQLTGLQCLNINNLNKMSAFCFVDMARCLTQLTHLETELMGIEDDDAPRLVAGLAALPLKELCVLSYGSRIAGEVDDLTDPAVVGELLGQLSSLTSLTMMVGCYSWGALAASLAGLTGLEVLVLSGGLQDSRRAVMYDDAEACEQFVQTIAGLQELRCLVAYHSWFGPGYEERDRPHPIMQLQAATQLECLYILGLEPEPGYQEVDWAALVGSVQANCAQDIEFGGELAPFADASAMSPS
jgi:hypothetical protein